MHSPTPPRFRGFFRVPRPLFVQPAGNPVPPSSVAPMVTQPDAVNTQGSSPDVIQSWQEEFMRDMKTCWKQLLVTLHLSQPWVPLFRSRTWAPTRCGSWVPLTTERHHGLSVRPDQNEQTAASVRPDACLPSSPIYTLLHPRAFAKFFSSDPSHIAQPAGTNWDQFVGDAPPQPTVGPAVPSENMGPIPLRQLSPSDDREASRAQHKAGSKRADGGVRQSSPSSQRSSTDWHRARVRHRQMSSDSSSPTKRLSPPAKHSRFGSRHVPRGSSSSAGSARSPRTRLFRRSRSPGPCRRGPSPQVQDRPFRGWHD